MNAVHRMPLSSRLKPPSQAPLRMAPRSLVLTLGALCMIPLASAQVGCAVSDQSLLRRQSLFGGTVPTDTHDPDGSSHSRERDGGLFGSPDRATPRSGSQGAFQAGRGRPDASGDAPFAAVPSTGNRFELFKIEGNVWRTSLSAAQTFSMLARVISQNYILAHTDKRNLNLQSDWDKFFIDGRLFRNRISVSVFPVGPRQTEVVVKNSLEYYSGQHGQGDVAGAHAWLPSPDITDEVSRIVDAVNRQTAFMGNGMGRTAR